MSKKGFFMFLQILVLGSFQIYLDGVSVSQFGFERVRGLLAYLAVEMDKVHLRNELACLLWPDVEPRVAMQNLRQALTVLRRLLGGKAMENSFWVITSSTVQFNSSGDCWIDLTLFQQLVEEVKKHNHRRLGACAICIQKLKRMAELYHGEFLANVFVDSEPFEEWLVGKRKILHEQILWALECLGGYYFQNREFETAVTYAQRLLALSPFSVVGHHLLIESLAYHGQRHAALRAYEAYRRLLKSELGILPPAKTMELHRLLLSDNWSTAVATAPSPQFPYPITPLVGYKQELTHILHHLNDVQTRLISLTGPGGSGKTRLAMEVAHLERYHFKDGVFFIDLEHVTANQLLPMILQLVAPSALPHKDPKFQLLSWLKNKEILLILDPFDHLLEQAMSIYTLLNTSPSLRILVTSQEWLKLRTETIIEIKGFAYAGLEEELTADFYEAEQFLIARAQCVQTSFQVQSHDEHKALRQICHAVGGLPLALELTAYLIDTFSLSEIAQKLIEGLDILDMAVSASLPARQHGLRQVFMAAWERLLPEEKRVFSQLSVFAGEFNKATAVTIVQTSLATLWSLQTKSLLQVPRHLTNQLAMQRYHIPEVFRFYGQEILQESPVQEEKLMRIYSAYFLQFLQQNMSQYEATPSENILNTLRLEMPNILKAWDWAIKNQYYQDIAQVQYHLVNYYYSQNKPEKATAILNQAIETLSQPRRQYPPTK